MKFIWNFDRTKYFDLEKVRNFSIEPFENVKKLKVVAWFSDTESLLVGMFDSRVDAEDFLEVLMKENECYG